MGRQGQQHAEQVPFAEGFGHKAIHAGREDSLAISRHGVRGQTDHARAGQALSRFIRTDPASRFEAVHQGHLPVHEDDIERALLECREGRHPVRGNADGVASAFEHGARDGLVERVVLRDQDPQRRRRGRGRGEQRNRSGDIGNPTRQFEFERRPHSPRTSDPNLALHEGRQLFGDVKAKARAVLRP